MQKEYAEHQREEDEEIEDMLNDGSLSSADDFDRAYGEPFDPNKCEQRIVEVFFKRVTATFPYLRRTILCFSLIIHLIRTEHLRLSFQKMKQAENL